jgi:hypothetical protein
MTNDVRDERLSRLLDAAANRIDVTPHIEPVVQRGSLRRGVRTTAMVAAVAVFVGAVGYGALRARDTSVPAVDPSTWNEYPSPDGWSARYPDGWVVQPFAGPVAKIDLSGAFFSNVPYDFHHLDLGPNDFTSGWDLSSFPRDGVAVEFERFVGGPPGMQPGPDTPFPLSLENTPAVQSSSTPESGGQRSIDIVHDGSRYTLNVWFGPDASQADREVARMLVTTIAFAAATNAPAFESGAGTVPADRITLALGWINAHSCASGRFRDVIAQGSTTLRDLAELQPHTPGLANMSEYLAPSSTVYAVVVSGTCTVDSGDGPAFAYEAHLGYVLLGDEGPVYFLTAWRPRAEPEIDGPFSDVIDAAFAAA